MRDPFYNCRADEIAANIAIATLKDLGSGLFKTIDSSPNGEVFAEMMNGVVLTVRWSPENQRLTQISRFDPRDHIIEVVLAA